MRLPNSTNIRKRLVFAAVAAGLLTALTAVGVSAQWPTTCVELNDIVEAHLGNQGNVGIYQKTFGDQAEQACQNDHRNDVRSVFAWAIGTSGTSTPPPATPTPQDTPPSAHPSYEAVRQAAIARGASADVATQIANDVITRGTVEAFLAGNDAGAQYGVVQQSPSSDLNLGTVTIETSLNDQIIELTVLEFRRGTAAENLLRRGRFGYESPALGEEYVAVRATVKYVGGGPPGRAFLIDFTDFDFIDGNGIEGGYVHVAEDHLHGVVRRGESMEGWLAAVINQGARVQLRYRHSQFDSYVYFDLR